jgi:IclR family transcriptional regulator, acetate operon repressor
MAAEREPARGASKRRGRPARASEGKQAGQVQSLVRALRLLEHLSLHEHGVSLTEAAQAVGLAASTAHRLLRSLEQMGYVAQDEESGLWFVGVKAFTVGSAFVRARDLVAIARPFMRELMEQSGETVNLAVLDHDEPVYLTQVECHQMIRAHALPGGRAPIHCSGVGKALLATLPEARVAAIAQRRGLPRHTEKTLTNLAALRVELERVRARGWAVDDEEHSLGMRCVASVLRDEHGEAIAAISLTGPSARVTGERLEELGAMVRATAAKITAALGGRA